MITVAVVLKSGGDFLPVHVAAMARQVARHVKIPHRFVVLSDVDVAAERIPLTHNWPGYWSKMELFRPDLEGDILAIDLDSVIVDEISHFGGLNRLALLQDFYHPARLASGVMFLPALARERIWTHWIAAPGPENHILRCQKFDAGGIRGDGKFLNDLIGSKCASFQGLFPGQIVSYKAHVKKATGKRHERGDGTLPQGAKIVCFHGQPRPWARELSGLDWIPDYTTRFERRGLTFGGRKPCQQQSSILVDR